MCICILDGREIEDRKQLHTILADSLKLPEWYGRNLDALYDCLTDRWDDIEIRLLHKNKLQEHLGDYAELLMEVLRVAAEEKPNITYLAEDTEEKL